MTISNRQQLLGIIAIAAVALLAGDQLVFTPLARSWERRAAQLADLKKSVSQGAQLLEREKSIRARWEHMRTNTLSSELSVAESQVLKAFDRWSRDSGVSISSIRPQWKRDAEDSMKLECRADASGDLSTLTRFLYEVEKDPFGIKVDAVEITARDNDGQQLTLGVQVSGLLLNPQATR